MLYFFKLFVTHVLREKTRSNIGDHEIYASDILTFKSKKKVYNKLIFNNGWVLEMKKLRRFICKIYMVHRNGKRGIVLIFYKNNYRYDTSQSFRNI